MGFDGLPESPFLFSFLFTNLLSFCCFVCASLSGSCWAHAAFSSIADRIKIATNGKRRDVIPSVQALINCGNAGTCNGGDSNAANKWVFKNGIPDVTCQQYQAKNMECSAINTCINCDPSKGCCK